MHLLDHLQQHSEMKLITVDMLDLAIPPQRPCCHFCDQARLPQTPCPVSFNLCLKLILHVYDMQEEDYMGQMTDSVMGLLHDPTATLPLNKRRRGVVPQPQRQDRSPQALTQALVQADSSDTSSKQTVGNPSPVVQTLAKALPGQSSSQLH